MNDEQRDEGESMGFMDRIKESPRTVSALIIILIVAAAIYAFSGEPTQPGETTTPNEPAIAEEDGIMDVTGDEATGPTATVQATAKPVATPMAVTAPLTPTQLQEMNSALPSAQRVENAFVEVAQAGDGITHLARRSATRWLAENNAGYDVTNEHRIYIEDYIKDNVGRDRLEIGAERTISFDLIAEAVESAKGLNEQQLKNLSRYTAALS